jgi:predicted acyl esterase
VVKLIDVYPDNVPLQPALGGYQLPVAMDILRGRYRNDPSAPEPIVPGEIVAYNLPLPHVCHAFLPGHRIMVQIQSSWFPLYDRNPQSFVENIFFARPEDFITATQRVYLGGDTPSHIELPLIP